MIAAFWPKQRWRLLCSGRSNALCRDIRREPAVLALRGMRRPAAHLASHRGPASRIPGRLGGHLFAGALLIFFAGSARYLLPIAAPVAILATRFATPRWLTAGFALQLVLSLGLATANYQHWDGYRKFAKTLAPDAAQHRVWVDAEWGLRYYLESEGALPLARDQMVQPGETIVSSALAHAVTVNAPVAQVSAMDIVPGVPLRLISLSRRSAYSSAAAGLLPFEISSGPADRVRADIVVDRKPVLSYLNPRDPQAPAHPVRLVPRWMDERSNVGPAESAG